MTKSITRKVNGVAEDEALLKEIRWYLILIDIALSQSFYLNTGFEL